MGNLLIRNVPQEIVNRLKRRAKKNQRSLQQEVLEILMKQPSETPEEVLEEIRQRREAWKREGRKFSDSVLLVRENRQQ